MELVMQLRHLGTHGVSTVLRGDRSYHAWLALLLGVIALGVFAYANQTQHGLITSHMRDQVSWGFYIGNFAFLVGVAAAAVVLVIPAYVYEWGPIKEVVLIAELMAISAIVMCILFVTVDVGRPERIWHMMPLVGNPNFPYSLLVWDILVLNAYLVINVLIVSYLLFMSYTGRSYNPRFIMPVIFLSIPIAVSIHTVTAFLFMGLKGRVFWHTAILAPRFLASAFCSGPAILLLIFLVLRRAGIVAIRDRALFKLGELLAYTMAVNLFFLGAEAFVEFYATSAHSIHAEFQWFGTHERRDIAIYTWSALACETVALTIFMVTPLRQRLGALALACLFAMAGVYVEKGLGLLLPGMTPDMLGEVYAYNPSATEIMVAAGVWAVGALTFTVLVKVAMAIASGQLRYQAPGALPEPVEARAAGMNEPTDLRRRQRWGVGPGQRW